MAERPILALPRPTKAEPPRLRPPRESVGSVSAERQTQRLGPKFDRLAETLPDPARLAELRNDPGAIVPERALVFEIAGTLTDFYRAVRSIGLEFLGEEETEAGPDEDFFVAQRAAADVPVRLYFTIPDTRALQELVSLWQRFRRGEPLGRGRAAWRQVFEHLIDIRPWGPQDRLTAEAIEDWEHRLADAPDQPVRFETEFWFRNNAERRHRTEASFTGMLNGLGGRLLHAAAIDPIRYHAALAEMPAGAIRTLLNHPDVGAITTADEIMVLRPQSVIGDIEPYEEVEPRDEPSGEAVGELREPLAALFDGLPMAQHDRLRDRLDIDDPDDFAAGYGAASEQRHGTAMASLILHGDLNGPSDSTRRRLYVRPVTMPQEIFPGERRELMPADQLGIDLMWRSFRRMLEGENGEPPVAPTVRVVNLSLGDAKRRFAGVMSPWAKLVDYVAWSYKVLVIISAGNVLDAIPLPEVSNWHEFEAAGLAARQEILLRNLYENRATRRLLSPSEALNGLTIGACHCDAAPENGAGAMASAAYESRYLPNPSSALGLGFRRSIKPELLFAGGREQVRANSTHAPIEVRPVASPNRYFGVRAAYPGAAGDTSQTVLYSGTSVAAALATHEAVRVLESLEASPADPVHPVLEADFLSIIVKTLMVHAARWDSATADILKQIANPHGNVPWQHEREEVTRILGYGRAEIERVLDCTEARATMIGWGTLQPEEADHYRAPLPPGLQGIGGFRAVTITVAWLTPLNLSHRMYRMAKLSAVPSGDKAFSLGIDRAKEQPTHHAIDRGTVFHGRWEGSKAAPFVDGGDLVFDIGCKATAGDVDVGIPYAVAVSIEVGTDVTVPVYQEVRERLRAVVQVQV